MEKDELFQLLAGLEAQQHITDCLVAALIKHHPQRDAVCETWRQSTAGVMAGIAMQDASRPGFAHMQKGFAQQGIEYWEERFRDASA
jgi:hypothetical protein